MRPAGVERIHRRMNNVLRRVEIWLADFQMNYVLALPLQLSGPAQNFEGGLSPEARHPLRQPQLELCRTGHKTKLAILLLATACTSITGGCKTTHINRPKTQALWAKIIAC